MKLVFFVTLAHILLLFCFNLNKDVKPTKKNKIVVRTEKLRPLPTLSPTLSPKATSKAIEREVVVESKPVIAEKKVEIKKAATTPPKKKAAPTPAKPKESGSKAPPKADKELLSLMKEGLTKIDKASNALQKPGSSKDVNKKAVNKIGALKSESNEETAEELSYAEELALYLKHHLHFPEEGKMKLALTLSREGQLDSFKILSSTSDGNKTLALRSISTISFPPFKDRFKERTKTFTIQINIDNK